MNSVRPGIAIFKMHDVSEKTQNHLLKVYTNLLGCSVLCAAGMYINSSILLAQGFISQILIMIATLYAVCKVMDVYESENKRMAWCMTIAFG